MCFLEWSLFSKLDYLSCIIQDPIIMAPSGERLNSWPNAAISLVGIIFATLDVR